MCCIVRVRLQHESVRICYLFVSIAAAGSHTGIHTFYAVTERSSLFARSASLFMCFMCA